MAVVNIALITDYDAGVLEGTQAVTAHDVLAVFEQNAERIRKVVLDMVGPVPGRPRRAGRRRGAAAHPRRRSCAGPGRHPDLRDRALADRWRPIPTSPPSPRRRRPGADCTAACAAVRGSRLDESMCERCNPLGLKAPAASQAHGTVFVGIVIAVVIMAVVARLLVAGVGPFQSSVAGVTADPAGLRVAVTSPTWDLAPGPRHAGSTTRRWAASAPRPPSSQSPEVQRRRDGHVRRRRRELREPCRASCIADCGP